MYLREKLDERILLKQKINELRRKLSSGLVNEIEANGIVVVLLNYINKLQTINLILIQANTQSKISIGDTEVTLSTAIELREAIELKVAVITELIGSDNKSLDIITLQKQRDGLLHEFVSIDSAIRQLDWRVTID
jgi:hypothetical protein